MKSQQSGFTLVEIAIVLVIIGLLLGGILKGQELINSAKVKNIANDFRVIPTYIYAYQDKFKALPGDDKLATQHVGATGITVTVGDGNGVIDGNWNLTSGEAFQFWQQVRLAQLASGSTDTVAPEYLPTNAVGGKIGISSAKPDQVQITGMTGSYQICTAGLLGKFAKQLDIQMDDGNTATGNVRTTTDVTATTFTQSAALATTAVDDSTSYTVCTTF
jgi:prepilin-type N-terminal cleavage/methylation domain-containing protein